MEMGDIDHHIPLKEKMGSSFEYQSSTNRTEIMPPSYIKTCNMSLYLSCLSSIYFTSTLVSQLNEKEEIQPS